VDNARVNQQIKLEWNNRCHWVELVGDVRVVQQVVMSGSVGEVGRWKPVDYINGISS
jgi:hypothetical protein